MISTPETRGLAESILREIEANPETHDQEYWGAKTDCGTTCCIAGKVLLKMEPDNVTWCWSQEQDKFFMFTKTGSFDRIAGDYLGLDWDERQALFFNMNNDDAKRLLKKIAVGEEFVDDDFKHLHEEEID